MQLERIEISGFRGIRRMSLSFDEITTLIGENTWDNPARPVGPEDRRRCVRSTQRGPCRPSGGPRWIVRLERVGSTRRSQQNHHWVLL